ncbi:MAG: hypothetical protein AAGA48_24515 [Myxococcota bacterium]
MFPCFQSIYDLFDVHPSHAAGRDDAFRDWMNENGRTSWLVGAGLRELNATDLDRWLPDGECLRLVSLAETIEAQTDVRFLPLIEGLQQRFRRSMKPVFFPIAYDSRQAIDLVASLDDGRADPAVWARDYVGLSLQDSLVKTVRSLLLSRASDTLPYPGWLRTGPVPLVEPAIDWLLDHGAVPRPHGAGTCMTWRSEHAVVRATVDRTSDRCVWFFGGRNTETLLKLLGPLSRAGLAPSGLHIDLDPLPETARRRAAFTHEVLGQLPA